MKTLLSLTLLLASANAFAMQPQHVVKTLSDEAVLSALDSHSLRQIEDAPSARCAGCFALRLTTVNANSEEVVFEAHGMDFGGRFKVSIHKME